MKSFIRLVVISFLATCLFYTTAIIVGGWLGIVNYYSAESLNMLEKAKEK
jgi:hypothetical protein